MSRKTASSDPPTPFRMPGKPVAGRTSNLGFKPVQKTPILGPVREASGESRLKPGLLKTRARAAYLGLSQQTMVMHRLKGTGPRFCKLSKAVRYRLSDLEAWIESGLRTSTSHALG